MSVLQSKRRAIINEPHKATSSGIIVTMDKAEYAPMGVVANFAPVQDLHGQNSPYPAGGGKNLIDDTIKTVYSNFLLIGSTTTSDYPFHLEAGTYTMKVFGISATYGYIREQNAESAVTVINGTTSGTFTLENAGEYRVYLYGATAISGDVTGVMIVAGSTAPDSYSPYANICPISGWTGCNVYDDSKLGQLVDWNQLVNNGSFGSTSGWKVNDGLTLSASDNVATLTATTSGNSLTLFRTDMPFVNGHLYYMSLTIRPSKNVEGVRIRANEEQYIMPRSSAEANVDTRLEFIRAYSGTTTAAGIFRIYPNNLASGTGIETGDTFQIRNVMFSDLTRDFGETIANEISAMEQAESGSGVAYFKALFYKDYYPYSAGGTYKTVGEVNGDDFRHVAVDWTSSAGTVYGGTFDVASGVLTVTYTKIILDGVTSGKKFTGTWGAIDEGYGVHLTGPRTRTPYAKSDKFIYSGSQYARMPLFSFMGGSGSSGTWTFILPSTITNLTEANTWLSNNNTEIVYLLETPITYTLTPTQIKSLRGKNNVWTDMNGNTSATIYVH